TAGDGTHGTSVLTVALAMVAPPRGRPPATTTATIVAASFLYFMVLSVHFIWYAKPSRGGVLDGSQGPVLVRRYLARLADGMTLRGHHDLDGQRGMFAEVNLSASAR